MYNNNFTSLGTFSGLGSLYRFEAHNNDIGGTIPDFTACGNLYYLILFNNKFSSYTSGSFVDLRRIKYIDLANNDLSQQAGNSIIDEADVSVGDTCILQIPEQKILEVIKLEKGVQGLITNGANAGKVGIINDVKNGTFVLPKRVIITLENKQIEIPAKLLLVVGKDKPVIRI